ncbi:MAG TPA: AbrB/MazE/SpoVT family DNA-binding domain-containing protein [Rhizomicrobium sp.]|nr:AbrB/MazE/SpoVT family DNA-binding domain-containing protein [Rhizomicrobium sp.]
MRATVKKWGNSASVRIPASVMTAAKLRIDQAVNVREDRGRVIIEPLRESGVDLNALLAGITDENIHGEIDFGRPVGKERL